MRLICAFVTVVGTYYTNTPTAGVLFGVSAGVLIGLIHALTTVSFKVDQIITGTALNLLALGITKFCCQLIFHSSSNSSRIIGIEAWQSSDIQQQPLVALVTNPFIIVALCLSLVSHLILFKPDTVYDYVL